MIEGNPKENLFHIFVGDYLGYLIGEQLLNGELGSLELTQRIRGEWTKKITPPWDEKTKEREAEGDVIKWGDYIPTRSEAIDSLARALVLDRVHDLQGCGAIVTWSKPYEEHPISLTPDGRSAIEEAIEFHEFKPWKFVFTFSPPNFHLIDLPVNRFRPPRVYDATRFLQ